MATPRRLDADDVDAVVLARLALVDGRAREARLAAQMTQAEEAAYCKVTEGCVNHWEARRRVPRTEEAIRLGRLLQQLGVSDSRSKPKAAAG